MKAIEKIKAMAPVPTNGARKFKQTKSDVNAFLESARRVNVAAWDVILEGTQQAFQVIEEVAATSKGVRGSWAELRQAWSELVDAGAALRTRFEPETTKSVG